MKLMLSMLSVFALTACSSLERSPESISAAPEGPVIQSDLDQAYLEAQLYIFSGNLEKAKLILAASLRRKLPVNSAIEFERMLARVEAGSGQNEEAYKRLTDLSLRFPKSIPVLSDMAQFLYGIQFKEQAYEAYSKLTNLAPEHSNYWISRGLLALELSKVKEAWESFDYLINKTSDAKHLGHLYMGKLLQMTNFSKKAEKEFRKCLKIEESTKECTLELAAHMHKLGRPKKAFGLLEAYVEKHKPKDSVLVLRKLLDWSLASSDQKKASHYIEILERLRPSDMNLKRKAALVFMGRRDLQSAKERMAIVVKDKGSNSQDISNYLHILKFTGSKSEQINFLDSVVRNKKIDEQIFFKKFKSDKSRFGQAKAEKLLKKSCLLRKENKSSCSYVYSYILLESGRVRLARRNLEKLTSKGKERGMLKSKYFLSQIYLKEGSRKKSMEVLDDILKENKMYSPALNFKAYTLSKSGESLKEAEALSLRALAIQPMNGHYLDTYGWILFKKGFYSESIAVLQQAVEAKPGEPEIAEHLADVFVAIGDKVKAVKFYKLASQLFTGENINRVDNKLANIQKVKRGISSIPD